MYNLAKCSDTSAECDHALDKCRHAWATSLAKLRQGIVPVDYDQIRDDPTLKAFLVVGQWQTSRDGTTRYFEHGASAGVRHRECDDQFVIVGLNVQNAIHGRELFRRLLSMCDSLRGVCPREVWVAVSPMHVDIEDMVSTHGFRRSSDSDAPYPWVDWVYSFEE